VLLELLRGKLNLEWTWKLSREQPLLLNKKEKEKEKHGKLSYK